MDLDGMVVALNQDTGKVAWRQTRGDHAAVVTTAEA
jgi:outer membrane protein assembly factor BamB